MDYYQEILEKTVQKNIPLAVHFELTYKCNIDCIHCYRIEEKNRAEMPLKIILSILDELARNGCLYIAFSGGEMFCRSDYPHILTFASEKGFAVRIMSNGTLLDNKTIDFIKSLNPLSMEISLYAMNPTIHDKITGAPGSFKKTFQALKKLRANNIPVTMKTVFMKQNVGEYKALKKFATDLGLKFQYDLTLTTKTDGDKTPLQYRMSTNELSEFYITNNLLEDVPIRKYEPDNLLCNAGHNSLSISPYGDVFPCVALKINMGNICKSPFSRVWNGKMFQSIRKLRFRDLQKCPDCQWLSYCHRCIGESMVEDGYLLGPATADCIIAEAKSRLKMFRKGNLQ